MKKLPHLFVISFLSLCLTLVLIDSGIYEKLVFNIYRAEDSVENNLTALAFAVPRETGYFDAVPVFEKTQISIFNN